MNKIFYKKGSQKNYRMYVIISWCLLIMVFGLIGIMIFIRNKFITVGLVCSVILCIFWYLKMDLLLMKELNFNAFVLNKKTNEFYKIGIYPRFIGSLPTEEDFMEDKHFLYDSYRFKFNLSNFFKYEVGYRHEGSKTLSIMMALSRLHDEKYVLKQLKKKNMENIIYKVNKIYSVEFIQEKNSYCVVCDVVKTNTNKVLEKTKMYINKDFDINNEIKEYIENKIG